MFVGPKEIWVVNEHNFLANTELIAITSMWHALLNFNIQSSSYYTAVFIVDSKRNSCMSSWRLKHISCQWKKVFLSRSHFDIDFVGTDTFLCDQNKSGQRLMIVMYMGVHNQEKPLPAGSLD